MSAIQNELEGAKKYLFEKISGTNLVMLSMDNVAKAEAMIQNDSAYLRSLDRDAAPRKTYKGSTAYWMIRLKEILSKEDAFSECEYRAIIFGAIEAVDRDNSTHINADGVGKDQIFERIIQIGKKDLVNYLKNPVDTELWLFNCIAEATKPDGKSAKGFEYKPRENRSFASKFCHYACFYLFEGEEQQDNYSIYDNILRKAIPLYLDYYELGKRNLDDYSEYLKAIDDILKKANTDISRNGFDHLVWYYFKGRQYYLDK